MRLRTGLATHGAATREASLSPSWRSRLPEPAAGGHFGRPATDRVAGMVVALRRRHPYEVFWMHGRADASARDTTLKGTALSAPMSNLLVQAALTAVGGPLA